MTRLTGRTMLTILGITILGILFLLSIFANAVTMPVTQNEKEGASMQASTPLLPTATPAVLALHVAEKPQGIALGNVQGTRTLWVASLGTRSVVRIDANTNRVVAVTRLELPPLGLAFGEGALWITGGFNTVERLDPQTNRVVARITVGMNPRIPVASDGAIWIPNANDRTVSRIDPDTNKVVTTIPIGNPLERVMNLVVCFGSGTQSIPQRCER